MTGLLEKLPPAFRENYVLGYYSLSAQRQSVSYQAPRTIAYDPAGNLILSYTGDPRHPNYHFLETLELDSSTGQFSLNEIRFPNDTEKSVKSILNPTPYDTWPDFSGSVRFNEHPKACNACHGPESRPIWSSYSDWPGFYGSLDDTYRSVDHASASEGREFTAFRDQVWQKHERYSLLVKPSGLDTTPFNHGDLNSSDSYRFRPNLKMTLFVSHLYVEAVLSLMKNKPSLYSKLAPLFLSPIFDCRGSKAFHATHAEDNHIPDISTEQLLGMFDLGPSYFTSYFENMPIYNGELSQNEVLAYRVLFDIVDSDSALQSALDTELLEVRSRYLSLLWRPDYPRLRQKLKNSCALLVERIHAAVAGLQSTPLGKARVQISSRANLLVRQCGGCHLLGADDSIPSVPFIPFDRLDSVDFATLKYAKELVERKIMPPVVLEKSDPRGEITKFIDDISGKQ